MGILDMVHWVSVFSKVLCGWRTTVLRATVRPTGNWESTILYAALGMRMFFLSTASATTNAQDTARSSLGWRKPLLAVGSLLPLQPLQDFTTLRLSQSFKKATPRKLYRTSNPVPSTNKFARKKERDGGGALRRKTPKSSQPIAGWEPNLAPDSSQQT